MTQTLRSAPELELPARRPVDLGRWPLARVCGVLVVAISFLLGFDSLADNSFLTHLSTGRLMLDGDGLISIIRTDPYTFTSGGEDVVVQSWLASLLYAITEDLGGLGAVRILIGLASGTLGGLVWRLTRRAETLAVRALVTLLVVAIGYYMWTQRPLVFGLLALAVALVVIEEDRDPRLLVPIVWVWAQMHGSFPLLAVIVGAMLVGRYMDRQDTSAMRRIFGWTVVGTLLGGIVNPYGPELLLFPIRMLGRGEALVGVTEWEPPDFAVLAPRLFVALVLLAIWAVVRKPSFERALPVLGMLVAAMMALRNLAPATLVFTPAIAGALPAIGRLGGDELVPRRKAALFVTLIAAPLLIARASEPTVAPSAYPEAITDQLIADGTLGGDVRVAHREAVGNYLHYRLGADANAFVDDRFELHSLDLLAGHFKLVRAEPGWNEVLDRYEIDAVLWENDVPLAGLLDDDPVWERSLTEGRWTLWARRQTA